MREWYDLERFVEAQDADSQIWKALSELKSGRKSSCWMWYVFPTLRGVGKSYASIFYGLDGVGEAYRYLKHVRLGKRLRMAVKCVLENKDLGLKELFGSDIDVWKFHACMSLFAVIDPGGIFDKCLIEFFGGKMEKCTRRIVTASIKRVWALTGARTNRYNYSRGKYMKLKGVKS